jgi:hypothetical protein
MKYFYDSLNQFFQQNYHDFIVRWWEELMKGNVENTEAKPLHYSRIRKICHEIYK